MIPLARVGDRLRENVADLLSLRLSSLLFEHGAAALLILAVLAGLSVVVLVARMTLGSRTGRHQIALPALLSWPRPSRLAWLRSAPLLVFLLGLSLFAVALADPYVALAQHQTTFPGRRIAIIIDASASMNAGFPATHLRENGSGQRQAAFFAAVGAAEVFIRSGSKADTATWWRSSNSATKRTSSRPSRAITTIFFSARRSSGTGASS